jgi:hypothetical protein
LPSRNEGTGDAAGDAAGGVALQFGGDQRVDAEQRRDRPRDELVGGGDQRQVAGARWRCTRSSAAGCSMRPHDLVDEGRQHALLLGLGPVAPGGGGEVDIGVMSSRPAR